MTPTSPPIRPVLDERASPARPGAADCATPNASGQRRNAPLTTNIRRTGAQRRRAELGNEVARLPATCREWPT
jgi:hypothetical protein